jgi:hypothetical protein
LETIIICGEYCRLYKFVNNEQKSWNLAYKLSTALQDFTTCVYGKFYFDVFFNINLSKDFLKYSYFSVTSRSISLRYINDEWISHAEKQVENIKGSNKTAEIDVVAIFWLSLADFYFDCKKVLQL